MVLSTTTELLKAA